MTNKQVMIGYALTGALLLFLFLLNLILNLIWQGDNTNALIREGGIIETASAFGYFLCAALIIYKGKFDYLKRYHYVFVLIIFFMLRELDFHERFTTMGIFKSRFYISDGVPLVEKIFGAMVILVLLYVCVSILYRHAGDFFTGLKKRSVVSFGTLLAVMFIAASKSIDGLARKLTGLGIEVSEQLSRHAEACEEILELGIPLVIFITLNAYFSDKTF